MQEGVLLFCLDHVVALVTHLLDEPTWVHEPICLELLETVVDGDHCPRATHTSAKGQRSKVNQLCTCTLSHYQLARGEKLHPSC